MTNKLIFAVSLTIVLVSIVGCTRENLNESITCINTGHIDNNISCLSTIFKDSKIIRLETSENSFIGKSINKIKKSHEKYYVSFDNKVLMVFDDKGKFISKIACLGGGPGEYASLADYDILPDGTIALLDVKAILIYTADGSFIKKIPLDIMCFNLKAIDENQFLVCASGEEYSIYLVDGNGEIISTHLKTNHLPILGRSVAFISYGSEKVLYQNGYSNSFLCFDKKTGLFSNIDFLCKDEKVMDMIDERNYKKRNGSNYLDKHPRIKVIGGMSSYMDGIFFSLGSRSRGFNCYLMNTHTNTIDYLIADKVVDDICFTNSFTLLNNLTKSDSDDCLITYLYADRIVDGLKEHANLIGHMNYQRLSFLLNEIEDIENENPILIELR
jgi:hypothetical protein